MYDAVVMIAIRARNAICSFMSKLCPNYLSRTLMSAKLKIKKIGPFTKKVSLTSSRLQKPEQM